MKKEKLTKLLLLLVNTAHEVADECGVDLMSLMSEKIDVKEDSAEEESDDAVEKFTLFKDACNAFKKEHGTEELKRVLNHVGETDEKTQVGRMISAVEEKFYTPCLAVMDDWGVINPDNIAEILGAMDKKDRKAILHDHGIEKVKLVKGLDDPVKILKLYISITSE